MRVFEAPAKLNLSLLVQAPRDDGYHPLRSIVQTIEWCDRLTFSTDADEDGLEITGSELDVEDNLVLKAVDALRARSTIPPLGIRLEKSIPVEAGLGGGSSDAAAVIAAAVAHEWVEPGDSVVVTRSLGADVSLFMVGGTLDISGIGDVIEAIEPLEGFAVAVTVPPFGLKTAEVYREWDRMEGPEGEQQPGESLPPRLRDRIPMRNDLVPAAVSLEPQLGDFMSELRSAWGTSISMSGSGSACFAYFATLDEASHAASSVSGLTGVGRGVALRPRGVVELSYRGGDR